MFSLVAGNKGCLKNTTMLPAPVPNPETQKCKLDANTVPVGYLVKHCDGLCEESACRVECDPKTHLGTARATCARNGAAFQLSGCVYREKKCLAPDLRLGYDLTECSTSNGNTISTSECHAKCAVSFSGNIKVECIEDGGQFQISGCEPNTCTLPATGLAGYATSGCQGKVESSKCHLQCAPGYTKGNREIYAICKQNDGAFVVEGCESNDQPTGGHENVCRLSEPLEGYLSTNCLGNRTADTCLLQCMHPLYIGTPTVYCPRMNGNFIVSGCERNPDSPPVGPVGPTGPVSTVPKCKLQKDLIPQDFLVQRCDGLVEAPDCNVVCNEKTHRGTAHVACDHDGGIFKLSGCVQREKLCRAPDARLDVDSMGALCLRDILYSTAMALVKSQLVTSSAIQKHTLELRVSYAIMMEASSDCRGAL
eukprot:Stramenopile-MAST_4_protein_4858